MTHAPHPIFLISGIANNVEEILHMLGMYEFAPNSDLVSWFGHVICNPDGNPDLSDVCSNLAFAFMGLSVFFTIR